MILSHASLDMQLIIHAGIQVNPDSKVHEANMGPIWGRQDPGGPHVVPMNFAIWKTMLVEGAQLSALFYVVIFGNAITSIAICYTRFFVIVFYGDF